MQLSLSRGDRKCPEGRRGDGGDVVLGGRGGRSNGSTEAIKIPKKDVKQSAG